MAGREDRMAKAPVGLTEADVVGAALTLIDERGLDGFSMRNVAKAVGVYPAAVYWHGGHRNKLLAKVLARVLQEARLPAPDVEWREWIRRFAREFRRVMHRHPNAAPLLGELVVNTDPDLSMVEGLLGALHRAGFRGRQLVNAYNAVFGGLIGFVTVELARVPGEESDAWVQEAQRRWDEVDSFPLVKQHREELGNRAFMARWESGDRVPLDEAFDLLLESLLAGLSPRRAR